MYPTSEWRKPLFRAPVVLRARHAKPVISYDPWRQARGRLAKGAACALLAGSLMCPNMAWAAEWVNVDGTHYDAAHEDAAAGWSWDGADDLNLNGYNGGAISAKGDLNVNVINDNKVTSTVQTGGAESAAVSVSDGDLTVAGEGSLTVESSGRSAVSVTNGDLTIDGATVDATVASRNYEANGLFVEDGDVAIKGGANVTVEARGVEGANGILAVNFSDEGTAERGGNVSISDSIVKVTGVGSLGAMGTGIYAWSDGSNGTVSVSNSTVEATGKLTKEFVPIAPDRPERPDLPNPLSLDGSDEYVPDEPEYYRGRAFGILATNYGGDAAATIAVDRSHVTVEGETAAMAALNVFENVPSKIRGTITVKNGTIVIPENGVVRNLDIVESYGGDMTEVYANEYSEHLRGQVIGLPGEGAITEWGDSSIAKKAVIEPEKASDPVIPLVQKAYASTGKANLAKTGDDMGALAGVAAAAAAAAAAVGAVAAVRTRKRG